MFPSDDAAARMWKDGAMNDVSGTPETQDEQLPIRVAWLYHMEGLTQADIADRLGVTRLRVNRLLAEARASGLVRVTLTSRLADCAALEQALCRDTGLAHAVIVPTPDDIDLVAGILGQATAGYLSRHLREHKVGGVALGWGATLRETIRHVDAMRRPELAVSSMMGGLTRGLELNTFEIASDLARRLNASCHYFAAPIYAGSPKSRDTILAQDVFRESLDRVRSSDIALLSVGDLGRRSLLIRYGLPRDVPVAELRASGAVGDVMGQFLDAEGKPIDHPLNQRAIALPLSELRKIPSVVIASGGANKVRIIAAVLRARLANVLVCDERTASGALDIVRG
jgi:DNA-binding transcriptional regulator LsrR (DeoR family)